jgi:hypothetical protein
MTSLISALLRSSGCSAVTTISSDLSVLDDVADLRVAAQQRLLGRDDDLLGETAGLELEIDRQHLTEAKRKPRSNRASEAGQLGGDGVGARAQRGKEVPPFAIGDAFDARATLEVLGNDRHTGQHATLDVADDTRDLARIGLRRNRTN